MVDIVRDVVFKLKIDQTEAKLKAPDLAPWKKQIEELRNLYKDTGRDRARENSKHKEQVDEAAKKEEKLRKAVEDRAKAVRDANAKMVESFRKGLEGSLAFARGLAFLAVSGDENIRVAAQMLAKFQAVADITKGSIDLFQSIVAAHKARQAAALGAAAAETTLAAAGNAGARSSASQGVAGAAAAGGSVLPIGLLSAGIGTAALLFTGLGDEILKLTGLVNDEAEQKRRAAKATEDFIRSLREGAQQRFTVKDDLGQLRLRQKRVLYSSGGLPPSGPGSIEAGETARLRREREQIDRAIADLQVAREGLGDIELSASSHFTGSRLRANRVFYFGQGNRNFSKGTRRAEDILGVNLRTDDSGDQSNARARIDVAEASLAKRREDVSRRILQSEEERLVKVQNHNRQELAIAQDRLRLAEQARDAAKAEAIAKQQSVLSAEDRLLGLSGRQGVALNQALQTLQSGGQLNVQQIQLLRSTGLVDDSTLRQQQRSILQQRFGGTQAEQRLGALRQDAIAARQAIPAAEQQVINVQRQVAAIKNMGRDAAKRIAQAISKAVEDVILAVERRIEADRQARRAEDRLKQAQGSA